MRRLPQLRHRLTALLLVPVLFACSTSDPAVANDATTATGDWLDQMRASWERTPLQFDFRIDVEMMGGVRHEGSLIKQGPRHYRMVVVTGAFGHKGLTSTYICDGEFMWMEFDAGLATTVIKSACPDSNDPRDPQQPDSMVLSTIESLSREAIDSFDPEVVIAGDEVRLHATNYEGIEELVLILNRENAFPKRFEIHAAGRKTFTITYGDVEFLRASEIPRGSFDYEPPPGANVVVKPGR